MDLQRILSHFIDGYGRLTAYPAKRKMKLYSLLFFAEKFEPGKAYTESEVNDIINLHSTFNDPATIRRELFGYGILSRTADGTVYHCAEKLPTAADLGIE